MIYNIIKPSNEADFDNEYYTRVYAGADATPTINGISVPMIKGGVIDIIVKNISPTPNIFVLGTNASVIRGY